MHTRQMDRQPTNTGLVCEAARLWFFAAVCPAPASSCTLITLSHIMSLPRELKFETVHRTSSTSDRLPAVRAAWSMLAGQACNWACCRPLPDGSALYASVVSRAFQPGRAGQEQTQAIFSTAVAVCTARGSSNATDRSQAPGTRSRAARLFLTAAAARRCRRCLAAAAASLPPPLPC